MIPAYGPRSLVIVILLVTLVVTAYPPCGIPSALAFNPQETSVPMINPDFEEPSYRTSLSSWVANGWEPWFQHWNETYYREPEFGVLYGRQRHNGEGAQRWFTTWATHNCGVFQRVYVPEDSTVTFSIWMISWCANNTDVYGQSDSGYSKWVGIDPYGGNDPWSPNIVWSQPNTEMDKWVQLSVTAKVVGRVATVFTRGEAALPVKHNTCIIDEARLTASAPMPSTGAAPTASASAPGIAGDSVFFPQTGHSVRGEWLDWFKACGNIDNNGLPISEVMRDPSTGQWVQYFQRIVLEYHPENPAPFRIQRRLLGDVLYPGLDAPLVNPPANSNDYAFFPSSMDPTKPTGLGHGVSNYAPDGTFVGFKQYFDSHGGITAFGFPKEEVKLVDGWWMQRFQAAVFQYHPENNRDGTIRGTSIAYRSYIVQPLLLGDMYVSKYGVQLP